MPTDQQKMIAHNKAKLSYNQRRTAKIEALETELTELKEIVTAPIDMIIFCPSCHMQHIDEPAIDICEKCGLDVDAHDALECEFFAWLNPPHKSHRCVSCNVVFRIADVPTNGVKNIQTNGENDTWHSEGLN